jgi:hypothetical protein
MTCQSYNVVRFWQFDIATTTRHAIVVYGRLEKEGKDIFALIGSETEDSREKPNYQRKKASSQCRKCKLCWDILASKSLEVLPKPGNQFFANVVIVKEERQE